MSSPRVDTIAARFGRNNRERASNGCELIAEPARLAKSAWPSWTGQRSLAGHWPPPLIPPPGTQSPNWLALGPAHTPPGLTGGDGAAGGLCGAEAGGVTGGLGGLAWGCWPGADDAGAPGAGGWAGDDEGPGTDRGVDVRSGIPL